MCILQETSVAYTLQYYDLVDGKCGSANIAVQYKYLLNFAVRIGKPADDSMRVKSSGSEAL